ACANLGLSNGNHELGDIYNQAYKLGLSLCPPEAALQYILQYKDQPPNDVYIAMETISINSRNFVFRMNKNSFGNNLEISPDMSFFEVHDDQEFIFGIPLARQH